MNFKTIIFDALQKDVSEHGYMASAQNRDIHERSLTHRLAFYLESSGYFNGYSIDCEYNRRGIDIKTDDYGKRIYPDIIVHVRGLSDSNLIIIEAKKFNDHNSEIQEAKTKLYSEKHRDKYQHAFLVIFPEQRCLTIQSSIYEIE